MEVGTIRFYCKTNQRIHSSVSFRSMTDTKKARNHYFYKDVIPHFTNAEFKRHFRMTRLTFEAVFQAIVSVVIEHDIPFITERSVSTIIIFLA